MGRTALARARQQSVTRGGVLATRLIPALDRFLEAAGTVKRDRALRPAVATIQKGVRAAFQAQGRRYVKATGRMREGRHFAVSTLREAFTVDDWLTLFDTIAQETSQLFFDPIQAGASAALLAGAGVVIEQIGIDYAFGLQNPRAVAYLAEHGYGLISQIDAVTRGNIATIVTNGVDEGWSYSKIAREITSLYSQMAVGVPQKHLRSRAELIAVTEAGNAYEEGNLAVVRDLQDAGLQMEKKWLTVHDDRVDAECANNEAEGWILANQSFSSGHQRPLAHPACRCTMLARRRPG